MDENGGDLMNKFDQREYLRSEQEKQKMRSILQAQEQLQQKKEDRKELEYQLLHAKSDQEKRTYTFRLERNQNATIKLLSRLKNLGVIEKRGRPKKAEGTHYQEKRKKFTAHLLPQTVEYLQTLKNNGSISNISAFLDDLVTEHQKKNS